MSFIDRVRSLTFGVYGESLPFNIATMFFAFIFGVNYCVVLFVFLNANFGILPFTFSLIDGVGGFFCVVFVFALYFTRTITLHYRVMVLYISITNLCISLLLLIIDVNAFFVDNPPYQTYAYYVIAMIVYCILPVLNYSTFFNLCFSLSAQHATFYVVGMAFGEFIGAVLNNAMIPHTVFTSVVFVFAFLSCAFTVVVFYGIPKQRIYSLLRSQKAFPTSILSMDSTSYTSDSGWWRQRLPLSRSRLHLSR